MSMEISRNLLTDMFTVWFTEFLLEAGTEKITTKLMQIWREIFLGTLTAGYQWKRAQKCLFKNSQNYSRKYWMNDLNKIYGNID